MSEAYTPELKRLPITSIKAGPNPRTEFEPEALNELAQSLKDGGGAVQPVVVYLDDDGFYKLIAGERRWRASQIAELTEIEAIVKAKPALHQARKMALVENMQREDLTPLEIAKCVAEMLAETDAVGVPIYTKTRLAEDLGKQPLFINWCEALLKCSLRVQQRVHQRKTPLEIAAMIGAQPSDLQPWLEEKIIYSAMPMSRDQARKFLADNVRRDLRDAQFKKEDATLEGKPACLTCEFWGGNRDDVGGKHRDSVCLNPACYDLKQAAIVKITLAASDNGEGVQVLGEDMRARVFSFDGVTVKGDSGYVAADAKPDAGFLTDPKAKVGKWSELVKDSDLKAVKIVDEKGTLRTLYDAKLALQAAQQSPVASLFKGGQEVPKAKGQAGASEEEALKAAKEKARATGLIAAGQTWVQKLLDQPEARAVSQEIVKLVYLRLTEQADRDWIAKVLSTADPIKETASCPDKLIGLALVARTLRLQGPAFVPGIAGDLAKLIEWDAKKETANLELFVSESVKPKDKAKGKEELFTCPDCGTANFTKRGLASHNCAKRQAKQSEEAEAPERLHLTTKDPEAWVRDLLDRPVPEMELNENGVFVNPVCSELKVKHLMVSVALACRDGVWHVGQQHDSSKISVSSGSSPTSVREPHATRADAVRHEITQLLSYSERDKDYAPLLQPLKAALAYVNRITGQSESPPAAKKEAGKRKNAANPHGEQKAWQAYLETGSIDAAAKACNLPMETVHTWHKRRGWKAKREAELKGK